MKKVYVITSGDYSDYGIDGIFDSEESAKKFISAFNQKSAFYEMKIEEWELNPMEKYIRKGQKAFSVRMNKNGGVTDVEWEDSSFGFKRNKGIIFSFDKKIMNCYCFANDEKHAVKIANEKRAQIIANNTWGESS